MSNHLSRLVARVVAVVLMAVTAWFVFVQSVGQSRNLLVVPHQIDLGTISDEISFSMPAKNSGPYPIEVLGALTGCGCIAPTNVPLTIAPGDTNQLEFGFRPKDLESEEGKLELQLKIQLLTDTKKAMPPCYVSAVVVCSKPSKEELLPIPME